MTDRAQRTNRRKGGLQIYENAAGLDGWIPYILFVAHLNYPLDVVRHRLDLEPWTLNQNGLPDKRKRSLEVP